MELARGMVTQHVGQAKESMKRLHARSWAHGLMGSGGASTRAANSTTTSPHGRGAASVWTFCACM